MAYLLNYSTLSSIKYVILHNKLSEFQLIKPNDNFAQFYPNNAFWKKVSFEKI